MSGEFSLEGRTALVTGASRGIGRAIALAYGRAGAQVAVLARSTDALEEVSTELTQLGCKSLAVTCDVTDHGQVAQAVSAVTDGLGPVDVLVNNAGGFTHAGSFLKLNNDDWTHAVQTNVLSVVYFSRDVGARMVSWGTGSIINVSSIAGTMSAPNFSHYCAAKFAVIGITRSLAAEWAEAGVRVNALAPGFVSTALTAGLINHPHASEPLLRTIPMNRWGTPDEVAGAAVFLASDAARLVTGSTLVVDGGLTSCFASEPLSMLMADRTALG